MTARRHDADPAASAAALTRVVAVAEQAAAAVSAQVNTPAISRAFAAVSAQVNTPAISRVLAVQERVLAVQERLDRAGFARPMRMRMGDLGAYLDFMTFIVAAVTLSGDDLAPATQTAPAWPGLSDYHPDPGPVHPRTSAHTLVAAPGAPSLWDRAAA